MVSRALPIVKRFFATDSLVSGRETLQAGLVATFDAGGEPMRGEVAGDFRAVQRDLRQNGARRGFPVQPVRQRENAGVKPGLLEAGRLFRFEIGRASCRERVLACV